jgi:two-component system, chemotaxis family, sensor kinase Cph1
MNQVIDFFNNLFSTSEWPARWHCGNWTDFHGWLYIISDLMIWLAYFLIPLIILRYF